MVIESQVVINTSEKMYSNYEDDFEDKDSRNGDDDFKLCKSDSGNRYFAGQIKFTPSPDNNTSKNHYLPSKMVKTMSNRRNQNVIRYKINRSLNFDTNSLKLDSNNSNLNTTIDDNEAINKNLHLSRSAKILKALNIDYCPNKIGMKKINKTLDFDSISPRSNECSKQLNSSNNCNGKRNGINKSLNFDDFNESPLPNTSDNDELIDINQNKTPSQEIKDVQKLLNSNGSTPLFDCNLLSPSTRMDLRQEFNDIVVTNSSSTGKRICTNGNSNRMISTPRNLCIDFGGGDDEEDEDEDDRPETPVNAIKFIPESMSSIKKSHRKERLSGRFVQRIKYKPDDEEDDLTASKVDIEMNDERPSTPPVLNDSCPSPNYSISSIKKSHKKDKSKRKPFDYHSDDEMSETGSLFDYSIFKNSESNKNLESLGIDSDEDVNNVNNVNSNEGKDEKEEEEVHTPLSKKGKSNPTTPENIIDLIQHINNSSIKKSHKKLKDMKRKSILRSRIFEKNQQADAEMNDSVETLNNDEINDENNDKILKTNSSNSRAHTPENTNSSRLLLSQFSSVKKSHKKDKHRKIAFAYRHKVTNDEDVIQSPENQFKIPSVSVNDANILTSMSNDSSSCENFDDNLGTSPLDGNSKDVKVIISSPTKRKSPVDEDYLSSTIQSLNTDNNSSQEEFQIFTPIKKRKSQKINPPKLLLNDEDDRDDDELSNDRCETPKLASNQKVNTSNADIDNGRMTPENNSRLEIISAFNSIKKSHKKDKLAKARKYLKCSGQLNTSSHSETTQDSKSNAEESGIDMSSPRPSTSHSESAMSPVVTTPPNGLGAMTYLKLIHTTSIKRSHKKMREVKKRESLINDDDDEDLSDDGSITDSLAKESDTDKDFVPLNEIVMHNKVEIDN